MFAVESAGVSDVGRKRKNNEDALFVDDALALYVVSDGMGGHRAGEVASGIVIDTIRAFMSKGPGDGPTDDLPPEDPSLSADANRLLTAIRLANREVHDAAGRNDECRGMGATVSAVMFTDTAMVTANVGDSPIYLIHDGAIELLSVTHNVATEQEALDPDAVMKIGAPYGHMLTRAMGLAETVEADVCEIPFFKNDRVVISSDGLSDKVAPEEILEVVLSESVPDACRTLVQMANDRGGDDNVTVITLRVGSISQSGGGLSGWIASLLSPLKKIFFHQ